MAPAGTPVVAADAGTVEKLFLSEAGGNTIYVRSTDRRTIHYYAHLQAYAAGLAEGQPVRRGQRLGTVGSTGNADPAAPHLHFAILRIAPEAHWWEPTTAIDPFPLLRAR
jgi:murein DD-endopeptidase MepM/ murein hydrolase activator NlpD